MNFNEAIEKMKDGKIMEAFYFKYRIKKEKEDFLFQRYYTHLNDWDLCTFDSADIFFNDWTLSE